MSRTSKAKQSAAVRDQLSNQVADFGGTVRDLQTRFGLPADVVIDAVMAARALGTVSEPHDLEAQGASKHVDACELLEATDSGYRRAGLHNWAQAKVRPGHDDSFKNNDLHRRAVASIAAARWFLLEAKGDDRDRLLSQLRMRLLGRKKNRHYRWELTLRVENKQPRHCPELIIEPRKGSDLLATVIEVLVKLRCQEELTSICTGWSRHDEVGKVDFYVTRETIGPLWTAIKAAKTQRISTVYLLPDQIQASALVDLRPAKEPVTSADPSSTGFSAAEQQQLSEILRWIAKWRAAGLQSMTSNLGVTSTVASRLLAASCERGLTEAVSFKQEDQLYRLTGEGARLAGMDGNPGLRIVRRTLDYFSRRARVAAILASRSDDYEGWAYEVVNPSDLGDDGPVVEVDCGGAMRPSHADILMKPCIGGLRRAIAVVLVTDYQWPCESLCEAWYSSKSVERVVFYAISAVLADLEEIIATAGMADKLKVVPMPLSDHAQGERERAIDEQLSCQRRERFERRREAQRQSWAKRCPEFSELTDQEWTALDPILAPGGPSSPRLWCGVAIDADRDVVDTILLAQKLGRDVRDMKATDGYAAGPSCLRRIDEWQRAGVWTTAWRMLAEIAPARGLPAELNAVRKVSRTIEPRGLFTDPSYSRILRGDLRLWEAAYLSGTG